MVPNAREYSTYRVTCANDGSGAAILQYCRDRAGGDCPIQATVASGRCVPNNRERFGNGGVTVTCPAPGVGDILIPEAHDLRPGHVDINWFANPGCGATQFDRTIVVAATSIAHLVPVAHTGEPDDVQEAYRVFCNDDGSGIYQTCLDRTCASIRTTAAFRNDGDCLSNPPEFGSSSVAFRCAGQPPPALVPFQAAGGGAAGCPEGGADSSAEGFNL